MGGVLGKEHDKLFDSETASTDRSLVGDLQYCVVTRPDIAFSVRYLCQFLSCLTTAN